METRQEKIIQQEIRKLFRCKVDEIQKADLGTYMDLKYFAYTEEGKFLVKLTTKYNLRGNLPDMAREIQASGIPLHAAISSRYSRVLKRHCNAYPWLEGKTLLQMRPELAPGELAAYGEACGKLLKRIHRFQSRYKPDKIRNPRREYRHYRFYCRLKKVDFPHKQEFDAYFQKHAQLWKGRPACFAHMDYQPQNIMLCQDGLHIIDFEGCMFTDPWMDFMSNLFFYPPEHEEFTIGLLRGYFPEGAPEEFYRVTSLMGVLAVYRYAMWKYQKNGKMAVKNPNALYEMYDGLTNVIPANLRGKV